MIGDRLRARGGFVVDMVWKDQRLTSVKIHFSPGHKCVVKYATSEANLDVVNGRDG